MTDNVNSTICKILKEKGFGKIKYHRVFTNSKNSIENISFDTLEECDIAYLNNKYKTKNDTVIGYPTRTESFLEFYVPTIAEVIMWLYKNYKIWIISIPTATCHFAYKIIDIQCDSSKEIERPPYKDVSAYDYESPIQAYEAAIEYALQKLI